jgi:glycosyltransferase involved in cell wall biosynthesis
VNTATAPVKIALLIGSLDVGGTERQVVALASHLDRSRFVPVIYCLSAEGALAAEARRNGVEVRCANLRGLSPFRHPVRILVRTLAFLRDIRTLKPAIIHGFLFHAYTTGAFISRFVGVRRVVSSRRSLGHFKAGRRSALLLEQAANRLADVFVANSEAVKRDAISQEGLPPDRVFVIYNGVELSAFSGPVRRDSLLHEFHVCDGAPIVAVVANFIAYKGHESFLHAWQIVHRHRPDAVALLVGDGPTRTAIERRSAELGVADSLRFAGGRADVPSLLRAVDFLVHPSEQE